MIYLTELELARPLTEAELKSYDEYVSRLAKDAHIRAQKDEIVSCRNGMVSSTLWRLFAPGEYEESFREYQRELRALENERLDCELKSWEKDSYLKLAARIKWHKALAEYRYQVERAAFDTFNVAHLLHMSKGYSLPDMIGQYDNVKQTCNASGLLQFARRKQNYAKEKLLQLEQEESLLWVTLDPDNDLGEARRAVLGEVIGKLFTLYIEHIAPDLMDHPTQLVSDKEPAMQTAAHDNFTIHDEVSVPSLPKKDIPVRTSRKNGKHILPEDKRDASVNLDRFLFGIKTADFDRVAKAAGFWPPSVNIVTNSADHANWNVTYPAAKLNAVYDAILEEELWTGQKQDIIPAMSSRLGYPRQRLDNTHPEVYFTAKDLASEALAAILKPGKSR